MILSDVIVHGLTACIAFILQIVIFKMTTQRSLRYWILILAGIAIFATSYFGISFPKSGFIALVLLLATKSYKNLRHTILETFFIPFTFALMVRLVIFLIIPIFFPSVILKERCNIVNISTFHKVLLFGYHLKEELVVHDQKKKEKRKKTSASDIWQTERK